MAQVNASVAFYAYISGSWTQLSDAAKAADVKMFWGMPDNSPLSRVADAGEIRFVLKNANGQYTPGGPSALAGWKKGIPVKMVITFEGLEYIYRYYIDNIEIGKSNTDKRVYVTALDWMDYAQKHPIINPGIQTSQTGDDVITTVLTDAEIAPQATSLDAGFEIFPTTFDTVTSKTKAYSEFQKVAFSELGYVYQRYDDTYGETLVFESSNARYGWREAGEIPVTTSESGFLKKEDGDYLLKEDGGKIVLNESAAYTFDDTFFVDYDAPYGAHVINRMAVYAYPRRLDTSAQILFQLDYPISITSGQTYTLKGYYADPNGGLPINGQNMITPVATTDYLANTASDGSGTNITASISISITYGTEGFTALITNSNASSGFITKFNTRGTGIYLYNPIEHAATNSDSIDEFDVESETLHQKYKNTLDSGVVFVDSQVEEYKQPRIVLNSISFCANSSPAHMMAFLYTDIGALRYVEIPELGITGNYYVQGIEAEMRSGLIFVKWILLLSLSLQPSCGLSPIAVDFVNSSDVIDYGSITKVSADSVTSISFSAWIYIRTNGGADIIMTVSRSNSNRTSLQIQSDGGGATLIFFAPRYSVSSGAWTVAGPAFSLNAWHHVAATYTYDTSADPVIYIDGVAQTATETITPSGSLISIADAKVTIGGYQNNSGAYSNNIDGLIKDPRIYANKTLSASEVTTLYNSGTMDESLVTDGLTFQGFVVRTEELTDYTDVTLTSSLKLFDGQFKAVGTPHGSPVGRTP